MQAINDNRDPIQELPNEMFSSILSFLPPSSIAHSSAASRLWRNTILSSPTLHQEIELTSMSSDEDLLQILDHYRRLSSLALNRVVKLSLNLTPFYKEFEKLIEDKDECSAALEILLSTMSSSKATLKKINLVIDDPHVSGDYYYEIVPFLLRLLQDFKAFNYLQQVSLMAPTSYHFQCGDDTDKQLILRKTENGIEMQRKADVMKAAMKLTQSLFVEFGSDGTDAPFDEEETRSLMEQLNSSTFTMKRLNLSDLQLNDPRELWAFVLNFKHVENLQLYLGVNETEPIGGTIEVSQAIPPAVNLRVLDLVMNRLPVDWESITRWAGGNLEVLELQLDFVSRNKISFVSVIIGSQRSLKKIWLSIIGYKDVNDFIPKEPSTSKLCFPLLEELYLKDQSMLAFFSDQNLPNLQSFSVAHFGSATQSNLESLARLLKAQSETLVNLSLTFWDFFNLQLPEPFTFQRLKELRITSSLVEWLSLHHYPNLISINCGHSEFRANAPNLEESNSESNVSS